MKQFLSACLFAAVAVSFVGCGDDSSPSSPSPVAAVPVVAAPVVPATAALTITNVSPNPAPWTLNGAVPCLTAAHPNTWSYALTIRETAGVAVTLTHYSDAPEFPQQRVLDPVATVPAGGSVNRFPNQCWTLGSGHSSQITYFGTDANGHAVSVVGPVVILSPQP